MDILPHLIFAATEASNQESSGGLLTALGIDGTLLLLQSLAFLALVFVLGKFVYPHLIKAIDDRRATIEAGLEKAKKAEAELQSVQQKVAEIVQSARSEASDIVMNSQKEAAHMVTIAETKAQKRAEQIVADARAEVQNELVAARTQLRQETAQLVARATEKIIAQKLDPQKDAALIEASLKEVN